MMGIGSVLFDFSTEDAPLTDSVRKGLLIEYSAR